jgi:rubrerythrin
MNKCACGCGEKVKWTWKRGHVGRTPEGRAKTHSWAKENPFVLREDKKRHSRTMYQYRQKRKDENTFRCDLCGIVEWRGQMMSLIVDHIDGQPWNNVLENLRLVCPNCASLLPTHGGRNIGRKNTLGSS